MPESTADGFELRMLRKRDARAWRERIRASLRACGNRVDAAAALGVSVRTLARLLTAEPRLRAGIPLRGPGAPGKQE